MGKFSDRDFGANVDKKTIEIFNALQRGQYEFRPSIVTKPTYKILRRKNHILECGLRFTSGSVLMIFLYSINDNKLIVMNQINLWVRVFCRKHRESLFKTNCEYFYIIKTKVLWCCTKNNCRVCCSQ